MDINKYQKLMLSLFKKHKTLSSKDAEILDWAMGLGGESGEVLELIKHQMFSNEKVDRMKLCKELGDVLWYVTALATSYDLSMQEVMDFNKLKLFHRYENGYTDNESFQRHSKEKQLEDTIEYKNFTRSLHNRQSYIFLGPDGSGKTTLAKKLSEKLNLPYIKCTYAEKNKKLLFQNAINTVKFNSVILDRLYYPDNAIYSAALNRDISEEDNIDSLEALEALEDSKITIILVTSDANVLFERLSSRGDEYIPIDNEFLNTLVKDYDVFYNQITARKMKIVRLHTENITFDGDKYLDMLMQNLFYLNGFL